MRSSFSVLRAFVVLFSLALAACNDGGGGSGSGSADDPAPPSGELNPGLPGFIFTGVLWDASAGTFTRLPNTDWASRKETLFPGHGNSLQIGVTAASRYDREEFVVRVKECREIDYPYFMDCIIIQGFDGEIRARFEVPDEIEGVRLSPDGQYIALWRWEINIDDEWRIYDRQGNLVSKRVMTPRNYDWLPDGRLVYTGPGKSLHFTAPYSTEFQSGIELPDDVPGYPSHLAVSPDGRQIAFIMITSQTRFVVTHGTPWIMNIDGSGLRQVATTPSEEPVINWPRWSPDGKWLLLEVGGFQGIGPENPGKKSHHYVVPTADMGKVFMLDRYNGENTSPEAMPLYRYINGESGDLTTWTFGGSTRWVR